MEGCLTFQLGGGCFSDGGASFLSAGGALPGGIGFDGGGGGEKNCRIGGWPPHALHTMGNPRDECS